MMLGTRSHPRLMETSNRRLFYRHRVNLHITLRVSGMRAPVQATLLDLSGGGGLIETKSALPAPAAVEFDLPREGAPHLRLPGRIQKATFLPAGRRFKYAVEFDALDEDVRETLLRFISFEQRRTLRPEDGRRPPVPPRSLEQRAHRRRNANLPARIAIKDVIAPIDATLLDVSTGGARLQIEQVLRQEWDLTLRFSLRGEREIKLRARVLPGVKQQRGRYIQSVVWVDPDPLATRAIDTFVRIANSNGHG